MGTRGDGQPGAAGAPLSEPSGRPRPPDTGRRRGRQSRRDSDGSLQSLVRSSHPSPNLFAHAEAVGGNREAGVNAATRRKERRVQDVEVVQIVGPIVSIEYA